jgi:hypothetical protein
MPGRHYMGVDYRPDHSFRIPRPDLSLVLDTPDACSRCHVDKTAQWSVDAMAKWYGRKKRPHYGTILAAGRRQDPNALSELVRLSEDRLYPDIVRATALSLVSVYPDEAALKALERPSPTSRPFCVTPLSIDSPPLTRSNASHLSDRCFTTRCGRCASKRREAWFLRCKRSIGSILLAAIRKSPG